MLGMVFSVPVGLGLLVWNSYRAQRASGGRPFQPEGKLRWEDQVQ